MTIIRNERGTFTATGRLIDNQPNMQSIPMQSEEARRLREAWIKHHEQQQEQE